MKPLVVPVNFSPSAANAARYAADMALAMEADLHLLHVMNPVEAPLNPMFEDQREKARLLLDELSNDLKMQTRGQVNISVSLDVGGTEEKIEEFCARINPFLVVLGAPGIFQDPFDVESEAISALRSMPFPLLIVPEKQHFQAIRLISLACELCDIEGGIPVSLAFLWELREVFAARFEVIHFAAAGKRAEEGMLARVNAGNGPDELMLPEFHLVRVENLVEGLESYLEVNPVDWLMVFPKSHRFLEFHKSKARKIVLNSRVPVLSICEHVQVQGKEKINL